MRKVRAEYIWRHIAVNPSSSSAKAHTLNRNSTVSAREVSQNNNTGKRLIKQSLLGSILILLETSGWTRKILCFFSGPGADVTGEQCWGEQPGAAGDTYLAPWHVGRGRVCALGLPLYMFDRLITVVSTLCFNVVLTTLEKAPYMLKVVLAWPLPLLPLNSPAVFSASLSLTLSVSSLSVPDLVFLGSPLFSFNAWPRLRRALWPRWREVLPPPCAEDREVGTGCLVPKSRNQMSSEGQQRVYCPILGWLPSVPNRAEDSTHAVNESFFLTTLLTPNVWCLFIHYFSDSLPPAQCPTLDPTS